MTHITIPTGTQTIGEDAFQNCRVLKYMRLPGTLTKLGTNIFKQAGVDPTVCKLGRIRYYDTRAKWTSIGGVNTKYDYFVITFNDVEIPPWNPFPGGSEERPAWITIDKFRPKSGDYVTITIGNAPKIDENGIGQVWVVEEQEDGTEEEVPKPATEANGEIVIQGDDTTAIQNGSISYRLKVMEKSTDAYFTFTKPSYLPASDTSYANSSGVVYGQQQQIPHTLTPEGKPQSSKPSGIQHKFKVEGEAGRWYQLRIEGTYHDGLRQTAFDVWVGEIRISGTPAAESPEQTEPSASNANSSEQPTDEESPGSASAPTNAGLNSTPNPSVGEDPEPAAGPVASPTPVPSAGQTSANTEQSGAPNVPSGGSEQPAASATVTPSPAASPTVGPLPTESASSGAGNGAQAEEPSETAPASSDVPASPDIPPVTSSPAASDDGFELTSASGVLAVSNSPASEEKHLTGMSIALAPTTGSLMDDLELPAGATAVLKDAAGNEITDGATKLATGQILSVLDSDGNEVLQTVVVVDGDVLGTGTMGISQLVKLAKGVKDASELTAAQFAAADRDGNGKLGITDLVIEARDLTQMRTDDAAV